MRVETSAWVFTLLSLPASKKGKKEKKLCWVLMTKRPFFKQETPPALLTTQASFVALLCLLL